jgi:hypothetical protein
MHQKIKLDKTHRIKHKLKNFQKLNHLKLFKGRRTISKTNKSSILKVYICIILEDNRNTVGWWIYRFFFWGGFSLLSYNIYLVYNQKGNTKVEN